ncbi:MAG: CoB--CoM heterodisulfide reductase iron-sulfur subunit B family protein [Anaerolineales bacterium]
MKYLFYPGCSLHSTSSAYLDSLRAIQPKLGFELIDVEDWNCCGANEYIALHRIPSYALIARNLALAEQQKNGTQTLVAACSACYVNLAKTAKYMGTDADLNTRVNDALAAGGMHYTPGSIEVRHILDLMCNKLGACKIKKMVERPLSGLKVAPYYGCMVLRPDPDKRWRDPESPTALEELILATGAELIDFPLRTHCCSGHLPQISTETSLDLIRRLVEGAVKSGADLLITTCPLCQLNIDGYQAEMNKFFGTSYKMPILFFTQLIGLAFGFSPKELGIGKEIVSAAPALARIGLKVEAPPPLRRPPKDQSLPMPHMPKPYGDEL